MYDGNDSILEELQACVDSMANNSGSSVLFIGPYKIVTGVPGHANQRRRDRFQDFIAITVAGAPDFNRERAAGGRGRPIKLPNRVLVAAPGCFCASLGQIWADGLLRGAAKQGNRQ